MIAAIVLVTSAIAAASTALGAFITSRVVTGVKAAETDTTLTLVDGEVRRHELKKADVTGQRPLAVSTMPDGLEKRLTEQEFVDLIAYLVSLKDRGPPK